MRYGLLLVLLLASQLHAQDYNVTLIPDSLKQDANAVKRYEELRVIIKSPGRAIVKHSIAITILNEKSDRYGNLIVPYSKFIDINDIDGTLYNKDGKKIRSVKKKDILDVSNTDDGSLIDDARIKAFSFSFNDYPYTVKYETEIELKGVFGLPAWVPFAMENVSVVESKFIAEVPSGYRFRYKQYNFLKDPVVVNNGGSDTYEWSIGNLPAVTDEVFSPDWDEIFPKIIVAPSDFEYGGFKGNMSSWQEMGKFFYTLHEDRNELPGNIKRDVHSLTDNITNTEEKIKVLYEYLQKNTRYISIQLGIGGFQPFKATEIATKKYGDCKGLSNYMVSLLKEASVNAYPVIVRAGRGETQLTEDFPNYQFNHEIVCVPGKDTVWLECTNQTISCGYMGSFTGNRKALLIKQDGGYLVSTPRYEADENLQLRRIDATIDANGNLNAALKTHFTCEQEEDVQRFIHVYTAEEKNKRLNEEINLPSYSVIESKYDENKGKKPSIDEYLKINAPNYASITGKRLFIQPNLVNKSGEKLSTEKQRRFPMEFISSYRDVDTIYITIPAGYEVESMPKDVALNSKWGKYNISFKIVGNLITTLRISERYAGIYLASEYVSYAKYREDIYKADRSKIVLVKKE